MNVVNTFFSAPRRRGADKLTQDAPLRLGASKKNKKSMSKPTSFLGWVVFLLDLAIALLPKVRVLAQVSKDKFEFDDSDSKPTNLLGWMILSVEFVIKLLPTLKESHALLEDAFDDFS